MMSPQKVLQDTLRVLRIAEKTRHGLQQIFKCARAVASHTRIIHRSRDDSVALASRTLMKAIEAYIEFRLYRIGNRIIQQKSGVPNGGFLSSALLHLHLSIAEHNFVRYRWPEHVRRHSLSHDIFEYFSPSRYEDDLHIASKSICPSHTKADFPSRVPLTCSHRNMVSPVINLSTCSLKPHGKNLKFTIFITTTILQ